MLPQLSSLSLWALRSSPEGFVLPLGCAVPEGVLRAVLIEQGGAKPLLGRGENKSSLFA